MHLHQCVGVQHRCMPYIAAATDRYARAENAAGGFQMPQSSEHCAFPRFVSLQNPCKEFTSECVRFTLAFIVSLF